MRRFGGEILDQCATSEQRCTLNDLVNQTYALTPSEIDLMWQTAPPRMPIAQPAPL